MNKIFREISIFFIYFTKILFRNKKVFLTSVITPLFFLIIFGFIFGTKSDEKIEIGIFPAPPSLFDTTLNDLSLKYTIYEGLDELKKDIKKEKIDLGIYIEEKEIQFYYNENSMETAPIVKSIINSIITRYEKKRGYLISLFSINKHSITIGTVKNGNLGYIIPGIIALSLFSLGMFSIIEIFARYRKLGILKRFLTTPMTPISFITGVALSELLISLLTAFFLYFTAIGVFRVNFNLNLELFILTILISSFSMSGFGAVISLVFKEVSTALNVASLLATIMIFFSGIAIPLNLLPKSMQILSFMFPLTYIAQNMRYVMGVEFINNKFFVISNILLSIGGGLLLFMASKKYMGKAE